MVEQERDTINGRVTDVNLVEGNLELVVVHASAVTSMVMSVTNVNNGLDVIPYALALREQAVIIDTVTVYGAEKPTVQNLRVKTGVLKGTEYSSGRGFIGD